MYKCLFFNSTYLTDYQGHHWLLIDEYDKHTKRIVIREITINEAVLQTITNPHIYLKYYLTYEMVEDIFEKTKQFLNPDNSYFSNILYLECYNQEIKISYRDIVQEYLNGTIQSVDPLIFSI